MSQPGPSTAQGGAASGKSDSPPLHDIQHVLQAALSVAAELGLGSEAEGSSAAAAEAEGEAAAEASSKADQHAKARAEYHRLVATRLYPMFAQQWRWGRNGQGEAVFASTAQVDARDPLSYLDPHTHSLAYLYILTARLNRIKLSDDATYLEQARTFIRDLTPALTAFTGSLDADQCALAPERVHQLFKCLARASAVLGELQWALPLMTSFIERYIVARGQAHCLSSIHPVFLLQALKAREYAMAYDLVLRNELTSVHQRKAHLVYTDVLEYFYYAGLICTKLGMLDRAVEEFEGCLTVPSQALSAIQVDAYKKLILVQLLKDGKTSDLPSITSDKVRSTLHAHVGPYLQLANAYRSKLSSRAGEPHALAAQHADVFQADANVGLVHQALMLHRQRRLQHIAGMFSVVALDHVRELLAEGESGVSLEALKQEIDQASARGWISARVTSVPDSPSPVVHFDAVVSPTAAAIDAKDPAAADALQRQLVHAMESVQYWQRRVEAEERRLARSESLLFKLARQQGRGDGDKFGFDMMAEMEEDSAFAP